MLFDATVTFERENITNVSLSLVQSLDVGLYGFDKANKTATIYDSGDTLMQVSNLPFIGRAVAAVLAHPEETKNKFISIASGTTSQNQILQILEQETGERWKVEHVKTEDLKVAGNAALQKGQYEQAFVPFLLAYCFGEGSHAFVKLEDTANKVLGLEEEDLSVTVKAWLRK